MYSLASVLRSLVTHKHLGKAWDLLWPPSEGHRATVVAPDLTALVPREMWPRVAFAQTAGLAIPGVHMWMPVALRAEPGGAEAPDGSEGTRTTAEDAEVVPPPGISVPRGAELVFRLPGASMSGLVNQESVPLAPASCYRRFGLEKFFGSPCIVYNGRPLARSWLVTKVANKRTFAHIEWALESEESRLLARAGEWLKVSERSAVLYEFLSVGQILANSASAGQLRERVRELGLGPLE